MTGAPWLVILGGGFVLGLLVGWYVWGIRPALMRERMPLWDGRGWTERGQRLFAEIRRNPCIRCSMRHPESGACCGVYRNPVGQPDPNP